MTTPTHLLTVSTPDKSGIIAGITGVLDRHGAELVEISQTVVQDYFTVIVLLCCPRAPDTASITRELTSVVAAGASVTLGEYRPGAPEGKNGEPYILTATGTAGAGVVHTITDLIARRGGNFLDFSARVMDGQIRIVAEVELPPEIALDQLQIDLEHAGADAGLQLRLQHYALFAATNEIAFRRGFHDQN
jgi:predicted amino acid-binding ACT domain protein